LPHNTVKNLAIDGNGSIWIGSNGLVKFDEINWTIYNTSNSGIPNNAVKTIDIDENDVKWIGTDEGLVKFDDINWTTYNTSNSGLPNDHVETLSIDGNGSKWIGSYDFNSGTMNTYGGLAIFNENGIPVVLKKNRFAGNNVTIFPNPTNEQIQIEIPVGFNISFIEIYTMQGNLAKSQRTENSQNKVDVGDLPDGIYIIRMHSDNGVVMKKMVKQ
jgi:hypothetical protein